MPNLIEQQDLLKGLPDARLAMLLKQPTGDIPPFLVAAEAQRRQTIRQQFGGAQSNESVVDSLTKQLVPQNIMAQPKPTPPVPPTPQMQGVMALQQAQGMAMGGRVRRFSGAYGSFVSPTVDSLSLPYYADPLGIPDVGSDADTPDLEKYLPDLPDLVPSWKTREQIEAEELERNPRYDAKGSPQAKAYTDAYTSGYRGIGTMPGAKTAADLAEDSRIKRQYQQYAASQPRPDETEKKPDESDFDYAARLKELFAQQEPSDWEKAGRWFAMSEQFLDPEKTTMQSIAGAGRAFADASGAMDAAKRQNEFNYKKALLDYDMSEVERKRNAEAERAKREFEAQQKVWERSHLSADAAARSLGDQIETLSKQLAELDDPSKTLGMSEQAKETRRKGLVSQIEAYQIQQALIMKNSGFGVGGVLTLADLQKMAQAAP